MEALSKPKTEKFKFLAETILKLLASHGEGAIKVSRLARSAKVSRAWIYKYVGAGHQDLMNLAVHRLIEILRASVVEVPTTPEEWVQSRMIYMRQFMNVMIEHPYVVSLFYRYRGSSTYYGKLIDEVELDFIRTSSLRTQVALGVSENKAIFFTKTFTTIRFALAHQFLTSHEHQDEAQLNRILKLTEAALERLIKV
ncbi:MAG: TetR/AcrR family transcriptional regulator [Bdellovibrionaceae bacterium]|nr:TetR/AcrR family transcriptional regulator [Pseudobdellovibrionaceae bacterium]